MMSGLKFQDWKPFLWGVVAATLGISLFGAAFVFSGLYNVAASAQHFNITNSLISLTLRRSVEMRSMAVRPPGDLSDLKLVRLGAQHFVLGCAPCHASPSSLQSPVVTQMYPKPPNLSEAGEKWRTEELFWIVWRGLKFTGMPSWPASQRSDEVWAIVAFLQRLPGMSEQDYAALSGEARMFDAAEFSFGPEIDADRLAAVCERCHGDAERPPVHPLVPPLGGQKQPYLVRALSEYATNRRPSGFMEVAGGQLSQEAIEEMARRLSEAETARENQDQRLDPQAVLRGRTIAQIGVRGDEIPACRSCHAADTSGEFPRLDGLPAEYIATQLNLFRQNVRSQSVYAAIMASIAARLSEEQIRDVAAYFAAVSGSGREVMAR